MIYPVILSEAKNLHLVYRNHFEQVLAPAVLAYRYPNAANRDSISASSSAV